MKPNKKIFADEYSFDTRGRRLNSIHIRVWVYFLGFTVLMLALMWLLQIFFVNNYYEKMKIIESEKLTSDIIMSYRNGNQEILLQNIDKITMQDDVFIRIERKGTEPIVYSKELNAYKGEMEIVRRSLNKKKGKNKSVTMILTGKKTQRKTWAYGCYLDKNRNDILFVLSPLYPVTSTVKILMSQFIYISLISLLLAFILSYFLSSRITSPIRSITHAARQLARGEYGITFPGKSSYAEISDLADTLTKASAELEKSTLLQRDLMANVSHDLRTPLTMVKSYAEMIRDLSGDIEEKRNEHLKVIIDESDRLNALVNDILTLSAVQAGTLELKKQVFSVRDAFVSILKPYEILKDDGYGIQFNCRTDVLVKGDRERIKQVIANLVSNSVKYCGADKKVFINVKWWGQKVHCEFVDHGEGIKPEELSQIWERHYKSSSNHVRPTKGSGIGLSIVKEILLAHGARFGVESKVGRGTTFWFELDVATERLSDMNRE